MAVLSAVIRNELRDSFLGGTSKLVRGECLGNLPDNSRNVAFWRAPCKGGVSQWVRGPPGNVAPAGSNRSSHGGNEEEGEP